MKRKKLLYYEVVTLIFANLLMVILHEAYKFTGLYILSFISAVNESVFEHSKIAFFSLLIVCFIEYLILNKKYNNFWFAKFIALVISPIIIIALYYIYSGILGYNIFWIDILIGEIALITSQIVSYTIIRNDKHNNKSNLIWGSLVIILIFIFGMLTYNPLYIDLFKDGTTGTYGL